MLSRPALERNSRERAVSPVIGVILMVAITVILAAVIGAFVLEIGDQQETAPNASFSSDQEVRYYLGLNGPSYKYDSNLTTLVVTHTGGETIGISSLNIKVNGNSSVWGPTGDVIAGADAYRPQPDHFEAATTNTPVTVESGDQWTVNAYKGWPDERIAEQDIKGPYRGYYTEWSTGCVSNSDRRNVVNPSVNLGADFTNSAAAYDTCTDRLNASDEITVVWRADSGSKTQTLTRYTIQEDGAPGPRSK